MCSDKQILKDPHSYLLRGQTEIVWRWVGVWFFNRKLTVLTLLLLKDAPTSSMVMAQSFAQPRGFE